MCRNERVFPHTGAVVCFCGGDGGRAKRENAVAPFRQNGGARRGIRRADAAGARTVYGRTENHPRIFVCNGLFLWLCDPCRFRDTCVQRACQSCKNLQRPAVCGRGRVFGAARGRESKENALATLSLVIVMIASGGLGMVQKRQQRSACAAQTGAFLRTAFLLAGAVSALAAAAEKRRGHAAPLQEKRTQKKRVIVLRQPSARRWAAPTRQTPCLREFCRASWCFP